MRTALKHAVETASCASGLTILSRRLNRAHALVLAYHNIVPEGAAVRGDASLHLRQADFADQLDLLLCTHDVVPLDALSAPTQRGRPRAAITFDDAYTGALTAGVAELVKRGLPATIFVAPAFIGGSSFWWDVVATDDAAGLQPTVRDKVLLDMAGSDAQARAWAAQNARVRSDLPAHQLAAAEVDLASAVASGLITLGSHTWSHPNLARLEAAQLDAELTRPLAWLRERFDAVLPVLTYPYGLHSPQVETAAARAGYESAFLIAGGWLRDAAARSQRFELPRLNVPAGLSLHGFEMRTSGLLLS